MIVVFHVVFFAALFGLGFPALGAAGGAVAFNGGMLGLVAAALAAEAVVVTAAVGAHLFARALGVNPLLQRKKAELISLSAIFAAMSLFLMAATALFPSVISVAALWVPVVSALVCAVLELMVVVKRRIIASGACD